LSFVTLSLSKIALKLRNLQLTGKTLLKFNSILLLEIFFKTSLTKAF